MAHDKSVRDGPHPPDHPDKTWAEFGMAFKYKETYDCYVTMVKLFQMMDLIRAEIRPEYAFRRKIDPKITIGGRIDIVHDLPNNICDILDLKGVKSPSKLDVEQLIFYRLGMKAEGKRIRKTGYLLLKHNRPELKNVTEVHEKVLIQNMKRSEKMIKSKREIDFPANVRSWKCPHYCDARDFCKPFKAQYGNNEMLRKMQTGKVDF
jgi:hypothetical protein